MDRTSWIGVLVCLSLLFAWGWWNTKEAAKRADEERSRAAEAARYAEETGAEPGTAPNEAAPGTAPGTAPAEVDPDAAPEVPEVTPVLENEFLSLHLTNRGAGIRIAELKKHRRQLDGEEPIAINEASSHGVGVITRGPDQFDTEHWLPGTVSRTEASFEGSTPEGFHLKKTFRLADTEDGDPYEVLLEMVVRNDASTPLVFDDRYLYAGSGTPLHLNEWSMQIGMFWHEADGKFEYKNVDHYGGRKILGVFGKNLIPFDRFPVSSLNWAGVNDQFFATIIQPETPYETELWGSRLDVVVEGDEVASKKRRMFASEAGIGLPRLTMNPGEEQTLRYRIYLGPKEYSRLKDLGDGKQRVMNYDEIPVFGWLFGWAIKPLASLLIGGLVFIRGHVGDFGISIILITILIRLIIWPVYAKSARSMKRMAKLTPLMKELREKYADDPQKMNQETMKLYRTYNINPLGGCLPMFIQLPVFLAFYRMLWSAVELRHESFLWVNDLAMPDTLFMIPGFDIPFNLLPILMGLTSFIQIAITPKTGDKTQRIIFLMMPVIFLVICYNFAAALSLYWTTSNAFSILQTWLTNKMPEPELEKKIRKTGKKSFMERMQEQAEAAKRAKEGGAGPGASRTKMPGEKGARHTPGKKKRR